MDIGKLPADTRRLWERLRLEPLLKGFVLIGGTALTMRIGHRISEDLDFAYLGRELPKKRLALLVKMLRSEGTDFVLNQDAAAEEEFINSGLALEDSQQNYLAKLPEGTVKVSFVRFENSVTSLLSGTEESPLRAATLDEIFNTKALACAERSKTRDWFDLYLLMTRHGYSGEDFHRAFVAADCQNAFDGASLRLRACKPTLTDEGYVHLLEDAPPTLDEMRAYFNDMLDRIEVDLSAAAFRSRPG